MNSSLKSHLDEGSEALSSQGTAIDPRPIFLAMQGGGAKGVAHVGALAAIEKFEYKIRGVSGTSAGSMVAALVAAGYKSDELVNLETQEHLFSHRADALGFDQPIAIFPDNGWITIRRCRSIGLVALPILKRVMSPPKKTTIDSQNSKDNQQKNSSTSTPLKIGPTSASKSKWRSWFKLALSPLRLFIKIITYTSWITVTCFVPFLILFHTLNASLQNYPLTTAAGIAILIILSTLLFRKITSTIADTISGLNDVANVSTLIDNAIAEKLRKNGYTNNGNITFKELSNAPGTIPLKIVATNVAHECLELFCKDRTPDVKIGDAVAASVCLPFVFKPWNLTFSRVTETKIVEIKGQFLDGGLVSNLPAWPFDEERVLEPEIGTIALSIESEPVEIGKHWTSAIVGTVINGSSMIHTRATGSTLKIPLKPRLNLMDFDASAESIRDVVSTTARAVSYRLTTELETRTSLQDAATALQLWFTDAVLEGIGDWGGEAPLKYRVRLAIVAERGGSMNSLSNVFTHGFRDTETDRTATRRSDCWIYKKAFATGKAQFFSLPARTSKETLVNGERIWSGAKWVACFPISPLTNTDNGNRLRKCAVIVDSNIPVDEELPFASDFLKLFMSSATSKVSKYFAKHELLALVQGENTWI